MDGKIIVIEGIDGSGKETQSRLLKENLEGKGKKAAVYCYPDYSSLYGERIKSFLYKKIDISVDELFFLYLIDMIKDNRRIFEDVKEGKYVIMDRFFFSTIAYQSAAGFLYEKAKELIKLIDMPRPDKVFYINISSEVSMERKEKQKGKIDMDKFESDKAFLSKVSGFYDRLKEESFHSNGWVEIDGNKSIEEIAYLIEKDLNLV